MVVNLSTCRWIERCFLWRRARIASLEASDLCVLWRQLSVIWMSASQCLNLYFPSNLSALILKVHSAFLFLSYTVCAVSSHFLKHWWSMYTVVCSLCFVQVFLYFGIMYFHCFFFFVVILYSVFSVFSIYFCFSLLSASSLGALLIMDSILW